MQITNSRQRVVPGGKPLEYVVMAPPLGAPGQPTPVAVRRWVLTQKALFESGQLAPVKLRYLNMLGANCAFLRRFCCTIGPTCLVPEI